MATLAGITQASGLQMAHAERVALAVCDLLKADPAIASDEWCGTDPVRVYRMPDATLEPDRPRPKITVAPDFKSLPLRLAGEIEVSLRILITAFYDESRTELDDTEGSEGLGVASLGHHIYRVLMRTQDARHLNVPRFQSRALVDQPPVAADLVLAEVIELTDDGVPVVHRAPQLQLTYRYCLDRDTGQPEGFP